MGELIQHDSSQHLWAPKAGRKWWLITSIDDHSRFMFYAKLVERDTTWPHIVAIRHIFMKYGLPMSFYVDSDSIFRFVRGRDELHYKFRGKVRRWADADTPIVLIDQGFGKWIIQRLHRIAAAGLWLNGRMVEAGIAKVWKR
ncbi:MAG: hypothetical protein HZC18_07155 [Candidatus Omnitrophica bacterium]|nr:hypothetical protein [Candidatus Omnitrophota bacterium]